VLGEGCSVGLPRPCFFHVLRDNKQLDKPAGVAPERSIRVAATWELGFRAEAGVSNHFCLCALALGAEPLGKGLCTLQIWALTTLKTLFCDDFLLLKCTVALWY